MAGSFDAVLKIDSKNFYNAVEKLNAEFPVVARKILIELAAESQKIAQAQFTPVKYGNLRSTIRVVVTPEKVSLVAGGIMGQSSTPVFVDYAYFQNYGTSRIPPTLFMERSVDRAMSKTESLSKDILKSWLLVLNS